VRDIAVCFEKFIERTLDRSIGIRALGNRKRAPGSRKSADQGGFGLGHFVRAAIGRQVVRDRH
jgi:hypothetical protein